MTIDLTAITTPFGLLNEETKAHLEAARKAEMRFNSPIIACARVELVEGQFDD